MAIKSEHYLFTFRPVTLHVFCQNCIKQILHKVGYTHHCYSHILEANHLHGKVMLKARLNLTPAYKRYPLRTLTQGFIFHYEGFNL